jgi:hypothetical protein
LDLKKFIFLLIKIYLFWKSIWKSEICMNRIAEMYIKHMTLRNRTSLFSKCFHLLCGVSGPSPPLISIKKKQIGLIISNKKTNLDILIEYITKSSCTHHIKPIQCNYSPTKQFSSIKKNNYSQLYSIFFIHT